MAVERPEADGLVFFRGRVFDFRRKFLPDGLSMVNELAFLTDRERRTLSQVQGRTYAYLFGLVERFISAKTLELASKQGLGDQVALEGLVRFSDEEIKHQELFRRTVREFERLTAQGLAVSDVSEALRRGNVEIPPKAFLAVLSTGDD